jgi:hypothetical protein
MRRLRVSDDDRDVRSRARPIVMLELELVTPGQQFDVFDALGTPAADASNSRMNTRAR